MNNQLFEACKLYNAALEHRVWQYKSAGKSISYKEQSSELKGLRKDGLCNLANFSSCQDVLRRLDKAFKAFFDRVKKGGEPGFPRFKSPRVYDTLTFPSYGDGCRVEDNKVYFQGVGHVNMRLHRPIEGEIKTISFTRKNGKYYVVFSCIIEPNNILPKTGSVIGIDVGIESLITDSNGNYVENPRWLREMKSDLKRLQRSVSRKKKGSKGRKKAARLLAKMHEKITNRRLDFYHKLANKIVAEHDEIYVEDLKIKNISRRCKSKKDEKGKFLPNGQKAKSGLNKSIQDAAWGIFFNLLEYKAENAGKRVVKVNPKGTSQRCNKCQTVVQKGLSNRWHKCTECGENLHRDVNSAKEILRLGLGTNLGALTLDISSCVAPEAARL
jgi:putative transposase